MGGTGRRGQASRRKSLVAAALERANGSVRIASGEKVQEPTGHGGAVAGLPGLFGFDVDRLRL